MYGAVEAGRPVAFGGTVRVTTLAELMHLIKEAEILTGSAGRGFTALLSDGATQRLRIGFDGYMFRVEVQPGQPALFAPKDFCQGSKAGVALEAGRLYTEPM
jgi:hypothetical protein